MTQQIVQFIKTPDGNLRIELLPEAREELEEIQARDDIGIDDKLIEACEYELCNGWEIIPCENIGLVDRIFFCDDAIQDDHGEYRAIGRVYSNYDYALDDEIQLLLDQGYVVFQGDCLPIKNIDDAQELAAFLASLPLGTTCDISDSALQTGDFDIAHFTYPDYEIQDVVYLPMYKRD